jgi:poly(3-hydroxybutyrate) depolymerase
MKDIPFGPADYPLRDPRGGVRDITVFTHRPASHTPGSPVVIVMHGRNRNGADYRDWWVEASERSGALVAAPQFSEALYPHPDEYNYGAMYAGDGALRGASERLFPVIDRVFEDVRDRAGSTAQRYFLFGHSAGGQVVHRLVTFGWSDRIERAVAANAGSYTMPLFNQEFPFGVGNTPFDEPALAALLSRPMLVLLGDADNDPNHPQLPREPGAMRQGPHRFARGNYYFETGRRAADRLGVPFGWTLAVVPGVAHSGQQMSAAAAELLLAS